MNGILVVGGAFLVLAAGVLLMGRRYGTVVLGLLAGSFLGQQASPQLVSMVQKITGGETWGLPPAGLTAGVCTGVIAAVTLLASPRVHTKRGRFVHAAVVAIALLALFVWFSDAYGIAPDSAAQVIASAREYSGAALLVVGVCGAVDVKAGRAAAAHGHKGKKSGKK